MIQDETYSPSSDDDIFYPKPARRRGGGRPKSNLAPLACNCKKRRCTKCNHCSSCNCQCKKRRRKLRDSDAAYVHKRKIATVSPAATSRKKRTPVATRTTCSNPSRSPLSDVIQQHVENTISGKPGRIELSDDMIKSLLDSYRKFHSFEYLCWKRN